MDPIARIYELRDEEGRESIRTYRSPPQRFRASELSACKRQIWYRHCGYIPKVRYGFNDDWGVDGDVHHDVIRQMMLKYGTKLAGITQDESGETHEDPFVVHSFDHKGREIKISTRQDGWIWHDDYGWMLLEIKSVGHWPMKYMDEAYQKGGHDGLYDYLEEKKPEWFAQVHAGMAIAQDTGKVPFPLEDKHTLHHAYILVKDRSNCHMGFHSEEHGVSGGIIVSFDDDKWDAILQRLYHTKGKVLDGTAPLREYTSSSKHCGYCAFRYLCHDADKRRKAGLEPAILYPDPACGIHIDDNDGT